MFYSIRFLFVPLRFHLNTFKIAKNPLTKILFFFGSSLSLLSMLMFLFICYYVHMCVIRNASNSVIDAMDWKGEGPPTRP